MDPFSITGTLIAIVQISSKVLSLCYDYRSSVKSSSREIIQITDELNSLRDVVESLLRVVEKYQLSEDKTRLAAFELLLKEGGPLVSCHVELERLGAKLEPETGWRKVKRTLEWPLKEGEMRRALEGLERLKGTMLLALSADQTTLSLAIKDGVGDLTQLFQGNMRDQEQQAIQIWLAGPDPYANHVANRKKRLPQTGNWLLTSTEYNNWLHGSKSFLWLYGIPGSGKSVLCSTIVENIAQRSQSQPKTAFAYFYFNFNDTGKRDVSAVVRSLIKQLAAQYNSVPPSLLQVYRNHGNGTRFIEDVSLVATLRDLVLVFESVYLIFDALDESTESNEVLNLLHEIQNWGFFRLHVMVTSRQLPEVEESLSNLYTNKVSLHESKSNVDIIMYVENKLENDKTLAKWPQETRVQIQKKLLAGEDGMFQWVVCQIEMLSRCMSVNAIRKAMSALPKSLDETYDRLLLDVDQEYQPEVMKILQALAFTQNPLSLEEIVDILAVDLNHNPPRFEEDSRLLDPRNVLSMCSSLVTMSSQTVSPFGTYTEDLDLKIQPGTPTLRLAHSSVADYLTQPKPSTHHQFHFSKNDARQFMAQTCLTYLLNPVFAQGDDKTHRTQRNERLKIFPFLSHCVNFWPKYLSREAGDSSEGRLDERTKEILQLFFATSKLQNGGNFAAWVSMLIPDSPATYVQHTTPLYYAASFGLLEVVRIILDTEEGVDINALGGRACSSALHVAVYRDHIDVIRFLLERGADPSLLNELDESPMYWAKASGNKAVQELLVEFGANENEIWDTWGETVS